MKTKHIMTHMGRSLNIVHDAIREDLIEHFRVTYPTFETDKIDLAEPLHKHLPSFINTDGMSEAETKRRVQAMIEGLETFIQDRFDIDEDADIIDGKLSLTTATLGEVTDALFNRWLDEQKRE